MISNQNNLKFSYNCVKNDDKNGLLNQNPLIITKNEAFSFRFRERVKYAQLLAKRDLREAAQTPKNIEFISAVKPKTVKVGRCEKSMLKKVHPEERAKSVKRLPGPQTPSKITDNRRRGAPSTLKSQMLLPRSMSPPVRDTDNTWQPRDNGLLMENLQSQVNKCTNKLNQLERSLKTKELKSAPILMKKDFNLGKNGRDLKVLEEKLRSIVGGIPQGRDVTATSNPDYPRFIPLQTHVPQLHLHSSQLNAPPATNPQSYPIRSLHETKLSPSIDHILNKLDSLATEMDTIKSRWTTLSYEAVSVTEDYPGIPDDFRFTKHTSELMNDTQEIEDHRLYLDVPRNIVVRLDSDRKRFNDVNRFAFLSNGGITPSRAGEWCSEDIVEEVIDDVIKEVDDANEELVEEILNEELSD